MNGELVGMSGVPWELMVDLGVGQGTNTAWSLALRPCAVGQQVR